jgi:hypothetical protein
MHVSVIYAMRLVILLGHMIGASVSSLFTSDRTYASSACNARTRATFPTFRGERSRSAVSALDSTADVKIEESDVSRNPTLTSAIVASLAAANRSKGNSGSCRKSVCSTHSTSFVLSGRLNSRAM